MDFALQEISAGLQREWVSPIKERITYIAPEQSIYEIAKGLFNNVAIAFDLGGKVTLSSQSPEESTASVSLSSAMYLAVYDRADEALLNDYEEIIDQANRGEAGVVSLFESLIKGVIMENPVSISAAVEAEWDGLPLVDRVVHDSAIPLNEEQLKILAATRHPEGRIIVAEGPPGTGKSHTLAAIAADCIQRAKSCLILSDKKEALDVVQSKLGDAMGRVRHDKNFPNPILRLGQQNANFKQLTSNSTVSQVTNYEKAMKSNEPRLRAEQAEVKADLQRNIAMSLETLARG
jgi:AAA domain